MKRLFLLLFSFALLVSFVYAAPSISQREVGGTTLKLISNTDQCLIDCEAWLEWDLALKPFSVRIPNGATDQFKISYVKKSKATRGLKEFGVEVWAFDSKLGWTKASDSFYGFTAHPGQKYRLRVWGKKEPGLGENSVDWVPTFFGERIGEWAWWDTDWVFANVLNITALVDLNAGYPIDVNHVDFNFGSCVSEGECRSDFQDIRIVCNGEEVSRHVEINTDMDFNAVWFPLHEPVAASATNTDCNIFYGNSSATYNDISDINHMATDANTWLLYRFEELTGTAVLDYSENSRTGNSNRDISNLTQIDGAFNQDFNFVRLLSDYVTFPAPPVENGRIEMFLQVNETINSGMVAGVHLAANDRWYIQVQAGGTECGDPKCYKIEWSSNNNAGSAWTINQVGTVMHYDQRYHIVVTWGVDGAELFIDGNSIGSAGGNLPLANPGDNPIIGGKRRQDLASHDDFLDAKIDEFTVSTSSPNQSFYQNYPFGNNLAGLVSVVLGTQGNTGINLLVRLPIDEELLTPIDTASTSFSIRILDENVLETQIGLINDTFATLRTDTPLPILVTIDTNQPLIYYAREYTFLIPSGQTDMNILQPYLAPVATSVLTTISTVLSTNLTPVRGIRLKIFKSLPGGRTLIHETITDSKGEAVVPFVIADNYEIEVYQGTKLLDTLFYTTTSTSTTLYIYIPEGDVVVIPELTDISVSFRPGLRSWNTTDVNLIVDINSKTNSISAIQVIMTNNDVNLWDGGMDASAPTDGNSYRFVMNSLPFHSIDTNYPVDFIVIVQLTNGQEMYFRENSFRLIPDNDMIYLAVFGLREEFGCRTDDLNYVCGPLFFIAMFIIVFVSAGLAMTTIKNGTGFTIFALLLTAAFTYLAWIPLVGFVLMAITGVAVMTMMTRFD